MTIAFDTPISRLRARRIRRMQRRAAIARERLAARRRSDAALGITLVIDPDRLRRRDTGRLADAR